MNDKEYFPPAPVCKTGCPVAKDLGVDYLILLCFQQKNKHYWRCHSNVIKSSNLSFDRQQKITEHLVHLLLHLGLHVRMEQHVVHLWERVSSDKSSKSMSCRSISHILCQHTSTHILPEQIAYVPTYHVDISHSPPTPRLWPWSRCLPRRGPWRSPAAAPLVSSFKVLMLMS